MYFYEYKKYEQPSSYISYIISKCGEESIISQIVYASREVITNIIYVSCWESTKYSFEKYRLKMW